MDDLVSKEETAIEAIGRVTANMPEPVQTGLLKALSALLGGLTAIPAAWMRRPAQAIDDVTGARSAVSAILAKGVANEALNDPVVMQAAAEVYLPTAIRKARNRAIIAQRTVEHVVEASGEGKNTKGGSPSEDWMNAFIRFAEDASSDKLQDLFARILSGEVIRPGAFSLSTLRAVAELDQEVATDFSLVWAKSVGEAVDYSGEFQLGDWYERWKRLAEAGLLASDTTAQFLPPFQPLFNGQSMWSPMAAGGVALTVLFSVDCKARWIHIKFTRVGRQIGSLLARPDYKENMRRAGRRLLVGGVKEVQLLSAGEPVEVIARAKAS